MNSNKLLLITSEFPPQPGGIGNHAYNLALELQKNGKKIFVLSDIRSKNGLLEKEFDQRLPFQVIRIKRRSIIVLTYLDRFVKAFRFISNVDTVIASGKFSLWLVFPLQLFFRKKYIAIVHGTELLLKNKLLRGLTNKSLKKITAVIAVSNYTKSLIEHLDLKNIKIIPNGVNKSEISLVSLAKEKTDMIHLITVGNVTQRKGQHNVIKAMPTLLKNFPKLKYHIVGIPTDKNKIKELSIDLGVEENIVIHGKLSEKKKWEILQSSTIFIMLSEETTTGDVEGFGIAIIEANTLGVPAIGSINCGIEDAIEDRNNGILVDPHNPEMILSAVKEIKGSYEEFSKRAKLWSDKFSWDKIIKGYIEVIDQ